ncbi:uncharacterized protein LOC144132323 isoform X5 [Amblyomma americanum]
MGMETAPLKQCGTGRLKDPHKKKSRGVKSGDLAGEATGPCCPTHWHLKASSSQARATLLPVSSSVK